MTNTQADPQITPAAPDRRAITWWWIAALFVVAVLIATVAVIFLTRSKQGTSQPGTPARCDVAPGAQTVPTTTPAGIEWRVSAGKTLLPYSSDSGPARVEGPLARCYAQDPVGSLLAASQIYGRVMGPNAAESVRVAEEQVVPGPQRDRFIASLSNPSTPPDQIQWRAFKFLSYTSDAARIDMVVESTATGAVAGIPMSLVWRDGDWQWDFESFAPSDVHQVDPADLTTYVPWSGVR